MFSMSYSLLCSVDRHGGVSTKENNYRRTEQQYYLYFLILYFIFLGCLLIPTPFRYSAFLFKKIHHNRCFNSHHIKPFPSVIIVHYIYNELRTGTTPHSESRSRSGWAICPTPTRSLRGGSSSRICGCISRLCLWAETLPNNCQRKPRGELTIAKEKQTMSKHWLKKPIGWLSIVKGEQTLNKYVWNNKITIA